MTEPSDIATTGSVDDRTGVQVLADTFVLLADTLVDDYDVVDLLDQLVRACVDLLRVAAAGLLLDDQRGNLTVVASSSEEIRLVEAFQVQGDEGPCLDCVRTGRVVTVPDLSAARDRWPSFTATALGAGFHAVTAVPLRLRDQTIGALNLFQVQGRSIPLSDQRLAQALAAVATIGILQRRSLHRSSVVTEQLQFALTSRVVVEQAKGVLAERHQVGMEEAFATLRRHARNSNLKLTDVARAVVTGELSLPVAEPVVEPAAGPTPGGDVV